MRIVLISNYFNHHQSLLSKEFDTLTNRNFAFVATSEMRLERKMLGYENNNLPEFVKQSYHTEEEKRECLKLISDADFIITGSAPEEMVKGEIDKNKLVFRYSERPLKNGGEPLKYLPRLIRWRKMNPTDKNVYLLSAGAYTAGDYKKFGLFINKSYKWGYFPETKYYNIDKLLKEKNKKRILWCGRFLSWKHPDDVIKLAQRLKKDGYEFEICFIGAGKMETVLKKAVNNKKLNNYITFLGSMNPEHVRTHMEQSGIYLFTSDRREGWGAVLNESMNSGCAVVASHAIGSVPYLINNETNGLIYRSGDVEALYKNVKYLLERPEEQERLGRAAYNTIISEWNAKIAAERLVNLSKHILNNEKHPDLYISGPCSLAEIKKGKN